MYSYARAALWLGITVQILWVVVNFLAWHRQPGADAVTLVTLAVAGAYGALVRKRGERLATVALRLLMSALFLLAVADRFGLVGSHGAPGVSWGDFAHFISYTSELTWFLPQDLAPAIAVAATIIELTLGMALLLAWRLHWIAAGSALLLAVYAVSMTISLPVQDQFRYSVFLLCAAMLALASRTKDLTQGGRKTARGPLDPPPTNRAAETFSPLRSSEPKA